MAIEIPEGLGRDLEDLRDITDCDTASTLARNMRSVSDKAVPGERLQAPVNNLTPEEISKCWAEARKIKGSGDKRVWQANALHLIRELSVKKKEDEEKAERKARRQREAKAKKAVSQVSTRPREVVVKKTAPYREPRMSSREEQPVDRKPKVLRRVKPAAPPKPVEVKKRKNLREDVQPSTRRLEAEPAIQVRLRINSTVNSMRCDIVDVSPEWVMLAVRANYEQSYLPMDGIGKTSICTLRYKEGDVVSSRQVLCSPCRYSYRGHVHIVFVALPDGV